MDVSNKIPSIIVCSLFLCFNVSKRFNNLNPKPNRYTIKELETFQLIKKLNDSGMGYRKISKYLNERGILTQEGNKWGETGKYVYSVVKRYQEREERLKHKNKKYELVFSKMRIELHKDFH